MLVTYSKHLLSVANHPVPVDSGSMYGPTVNITDYEPLCKSMNRLDMPMKLIVLALEMDLSM